MLLDKEKIRKKEIKKSLVEIRDLLVEQNKSICNDFITEKNVKEFNRNQDIIEAIEKVLEEEK